MTLNFLLRLVGIFALALLFGLLGIKLGTVIGGWWPVLHGARPLLFFACALLILTAFAFVLALPTIIRFSRCGFAHFQQFITNSWPSFLLLTITAAGYSAFSTPVETVVDTVNNCAHTPTQNNQVAPVKDKKEVSTDLIFDYNQDQPYSAEHKKKMDRYLTDLFGDYDEIEITRIVAHTDPIGSTERNLDLARRRGSFIRDALARVAQSPELKAKFKEEVAPGGIVSAHGPSAEDSPYWRACYTRFYTTDARNRPLEELHPTLAGDRPSCSAGTVDTGKDGVYPACRGLRPIDAERVAGNIFWQRMENFREMSACLAPMRHVVVYFNRARLVPPPQSPRENIAAAAAADCKSE